MILVELLGRPHKDVIRETNGKYEVHIFCLVACMPQLFYSF